MTILLSGTTNMWTTKTNQTPRCISIRLVVFRQWASSLLCMAYPPDEPRPPHACFARRGSCRQEGLRVGSWPPLVFRLVRLRADPPDQRLALHEEISLLDFWRRAYDFGEGDIFSKVQSVWACSTCSALARRSAIYRRSPPSSMRTPPS